MGGFEAIGDAVTGGLLGPGRRAEGRRSGRDGHTHEKNCLNCGTQAESALIAPHAARRRMSIARSAASSRISCQGLFNFEGKIWRTLPMLAWRPGEMTRRYIAGERARFISPVALYLFTVFAMFAVLNFTGRAGLEPGAKNFQAA